MKQILSFEPTKAIFGLAGVLCPFVIGAALFVGGDALIAAFISCGFLATGIFMASVDRRTRQMGAAAALMGQAIALTAALQGHDWQLDTHMLFFALLACLIVLRSVPALLMATVITAAHHLSFSILVPALVFPEGALAENIGRTAFHAVIVLVETSVLVITVLMLKQLDADMQDRNAKLNETVSLSETARREAEAARQTAEAVQEEAQAAQTRAEALLEDAKEAEKLRLDAESDREAAQAEFARTAKSNTEEQAFVVNVVRQAMQRLQEGDLTIRIQADLPDAYRDVAQSFNDALDALDAAVTQVASQSDHMQSQVLTVAAATADLADRTTQQAQMLRESSEGLEELTRVVAKTEASVGEANTSAQMVQTSAEASETVVTETSTAMQAIQTEAAEISKIVSVIDEIAFQTNLLSLNAGVEAARAGDAGRGFAVVASEVRGLAQRSSESATNIRGLIERSGERVEMGSTKIEETVASLSAVLDAVVEITTKTGRIADGAREQTAGISELNEKVAHLDQTTRQNAAMFEETSTACANLQSAAQSLKDLTQRFQVTDPQKKHSAAA